MQTFENEADMLPELERVEQPHEWALPSLHPQQCMLDGCAASAAATPAVQCPEGGVLLTYAMTRGWCLVECVQVANPCCLYAHMSTSIDDAFADHHMQWAR